MIDLDLVYYALDMYKENASASGSRNVGGDDEFSDGRQSPILHRLNLRLAEGHFQLLSSRSRGVACEAVWKALMRHLSRASNELGGECRARIRAEGLSRLANSAFGMILCQSYRSLPSVKQSIRNCVTILSCMIGSGNAKAEFASRHIA
jgi:hypothetical protein